MALWKNTQSPAVIISRESVVQRKTHKKLSLAESKKKTLATPKDMALLQHSVIINRREREILTRTHTQERET